jgi:hypothetical protein
MHAAAARGDVSKKVVKEFDKETKGRFGSLPARVGKKKADLTASRTSGKMSSLT